MTTPYNLNLHTLIEPYFDRGAGRVWVATCCSHKVFVGDIAPIKCSTCGKIPNLLFIDSLDDVPTANDFINGHLNKASSSE